MKKLLFLIMLSHSLLAFDYETSRTSPTNFTEISESTALSTQTCHYETFAAGVDAENNTLDTTREEFYKLLKRAISLKTIFCCKQQPHTDLNQFLDNLYRQSNESPAKMQDALQINVPHERNTCIQLGSLCTASTLLLNSGGGILMHKATELLCSDYNRYCYPMLGFDIAGGGIAIGACIGWIGLTIPVVTQYTILKRIKEKYNLP